MSRDKDEEKLTKEDKKYLNSKSRMLSAIILSIVEYILVFVVMLALSSYMQNGNLNSFMEDLENISEWFHPGGMLFNAIVGFLPIVIFSSIGKYFGSGTYGKMIFGICKCFAIILWLNLILMGASSSMELPSVFEGMGLDSLTIGLDGLSKFITMVMLFSILIPIGEFAGARKKHLAALKKKERLDEEDD